MNMNISITLKKLYREFGKVFRANWRNLEQHFALKSFANTNNATIKEIVSEVIYLQHNNPFVTYTVIQYTVIFILDIL